MEILQFVPFSSFVDLAFWHEFGRRKLEKYKLSEDPINLTAAYSCARVTSSAATPTPAVLNIGLESFSDPPLSDPSSGRFLAPGYALNFNTREAFQAFDSSRELSRCAHVIWQDIASGRALKDPSLLNRWFFLSYIDLKRYDYLSIFAFPALKFADALRGDSAPLSDRLSPPQIASLSSAVASLASLAGSLSPSVFLLRQNPASPDDLLVEQDLSQFRHFFAGLDPAHPPLLAFADPSSSPKHPGWPLRNLLALLAHHFGPLPALEVIGLRSGPLLHDISPSVLFRLDAIPSSEGQDWTSSADPTLDPAPSDSQPTAATTPATGWERDKRGRIAPKLLRLGKMLDPVQLAASSVALNLSLMRWRIMPSLNLEKIALSRVLIFGAGTLGCNVARVLLGWGVQRFAFVDNGKVSHSNPARQSLYSFDDAKRGRAKATAAAENLRLVVPSIEAEGHVLSIPMPGHVVSASEEAKVAQTVEKMEELIRAADVVFLLTDSRESRWLPSMLCAAHNKLCIDAALGFDTFVVMRHGQRPQDQLSPLSSSPASSSPSSSSTSSSSGVHLGCYFCNDVVAPQDSLTNRTLDQQCTVTRPGISVLASSLACELFVSVLQHPLGGCAPADANQAPSEETAHPLGLLPHQIRGYLTHFSNLLITGYAFDRCTACSQHIIDAYRQQGFAFILSALNDPSSLERVSRLAELQAEQLDLSTGFEEFDDFNTDED